MESSQPPAQCGPSLADNHYGNPAESGLAVAGTCQPGGDAPHLPGHRGQHSLDGGSPVESGFADDVSAACFDDAPSLAVDTQATAQVFDELADWSQGSFRTSMEDVLWIGVRDAEGYIAHCLTQIVAQRKWLPQLKCYRKFGRHPRGRGHQQDGERGIASDDPWSLPGVFQKG